MSLLVFAFGSDSKDNLEKRRLERVSPVGGIVRKLSTEDRVQNSRALDEGQRYSLC